MCILYLVLISVFNLVGMIVCWFSMASRYAYAHACNHRLACSISIVYPLTRPLTIIQYHLYNVAVGVVTAWLYVQHLCPFKYRLAYV